MFTLENITQEAYVLLYVDSAVGFADLPGYSFFLELYQLCQAHAGAAATSGAPASLLFSIFAEGAEIPRKPVTA